MSHTEKSRKLNNSDIIFPLVTFLFVWGVQVAFNLFVNAPHSLPDEIGALSLASKLGGSDWSHIAEDKGMYFGFGTTLPFFWLFYIFRDPIILYRSFLTAGAFLRSLPVFMCFSLGRKQLKLDDKITAALSVVAVLLTPTTGAKIDNEPMMVLVCWGLFYLIIRIRSADKKWKVAVLLFLIALVCGYSMTVHTRAAVYIPAALITLIFVGYTDRKGNRRRIIAFAVICGITALLITGAFILIKATAGDLSFLAGGDKANTIGSVLVMVTHNLNWIMDGSIGPMPFANILLSNLLTTFVFSIGMIPLFLVFLPVLYIKSRGFTALDDEHRELGTGAVFLWITFVIYLAGLMIVWAPSVSASLRGEANLSRGIFYLRYIGSMYGPCAFLSTAYLTKKSPGKIIFGTVFALNALMVYPAYYMNLKVAFSRGYSMGDFFCYYAVLNSFDVNFRNNGENFWYYLNPVIAVAVLFVLIAVLSEIRKKHFVIGILVVFTLFQYGSLVLKCDKVSADSALIWGDALYDLLKEEPDAFEDVDEVYYISERPGETVQVVLRDTPVYIRVPAEKTDNMVLYMDSIDDVFDKVCFDFSDMKPYMLDENEIIVTNNRSLEDKLGKYIKGR